MNPSLSILRSLKLFYHFSNGVFPVFVRGKYDTKYGENPVDSQIIFSVALPQLKTTYSLWNKKTVLHYWKKVP